ncbi:hypothetical protein V8D89_015224 [Ganoderma adspersum]
MAWLTGLLLVPVPRTQNGKFCDLRFAGCAKWSMQYVNDAAAGRFSFTDVLTGFEVSEALRKYGVEDGLGFDSDFTSRFMIENQDGAKEFKPPWPGFVLSNCREKLYVRCVTAPGNIKQSLEAPYLFHEEEGCHLFLAPREQCKSGGLEEPPEADLKAIEEFITAANSLLPVGSEAGFKLSEMKFTVVSVREKIGVDSAIGGFAFYQEMKTLSRWIV